jgi:hypothetical protein
VTRALFLLPLLAGLALALRMADAAQLASPGDRSQVVVLLEAPPLAIRGGAGAERRLGDEQRRFETALHATIPTASVHWRYRLVANGVSVVLPSRDLPRLARLPGVRRVFEPAIGRASGA